MVGWNPWAAARTHLHLEIVYDDVAEGAMWHRDAHGDCITISASATRRQRRALLAHELIHVERGIGYPAATPATMQREEAIVRRETAQRLVPQSELMDLIERLEGIEPVTATLVGEEFDVPEDVAIEAMLALRHNLSSSRRAW